MITRKPIIWPGDSDFVAELKRSVGWLMDMVRALRVRGDGATFYVTEEPGGLVGHALPQAASGAASAVAVKITGRTNYNTYACSVYANGRDAAATATGEILRILSVATTETIPTNTWLFAFNHPWSAVERLTVDIARDYDTE